VLVAAIAIGSSRDAHDGLRAQEQDEAARAQAAPPERPAAAPQGRGGTGQRRIGTAGPQPGLGIYPQKLLADEATLARGKAIYSVNCQFCHGADTRGGDSGPSLLRSQIMLEDEQGERLIELLRNPRAPMPKFDLPENQVADLAAYVHSFVVSSRDPIRRKPESIVTGDATAGRAYFAKTCASCHSAESDLKRWATRFADPRDLQQFWLMPGGGRGRGAGPGGRGGGVAPVTATVTFPSGESVRGRLVRIDEFVVSLEMNDGATRTFTRNGELPRVEIQDPLQPHRALLRTYTDKDIHDVTAFLVSQR
jgi:mono/diheme cytochrome c family protein